MKFHNSLYPGVEYVVAQYSQMCHLAAKHEIPPILVQF